MKKKNELKIYKWNLIKMKKKLNKTTKKANRNNEKNQTKKI